MLKQKLTVIQKNVTESAVPAAYHPQDPEYNPQLQKKYKQKNGTQTQEKRQLVGWGLTDDTKVCIKQFFLF